MKNVEQASQAANIARVMQSTNSLPVGAEQPVTGKKKEHIGVLDLLRGIAALSVVFYHYTAAHALVKFNSAVLDSVFKRGYLGVEIFFVISGFVIPYSLWGTKYRVSEFGRYMVKRFVRIAPPAYISLLLIIAQWSFISYLHPNAPSQIHSLKTVQIIRNLAFAYNFGDNGANGWINGVFWTLSIEFQFYVFLGLLFNVLFGKGKAIPFTVIFLVVSVSGYFFISAADHGTFAFLPLFALGGATLLFRKGTVSIFSYFAILALFTGMAAFTLDAGAASVSLLTALIIAFINIKHPLFKFFGSISYSLYLTHFVAGSTAEFLLFKLFHPVAEWQNVLAIFLCVVAACLLAYIFMELIEKPFLKVARYLKI